MEEDLSDVMGCITFQQQGCPLYRPGSENQNFAILRAVGLKLSMPDLTLSHDGTRVQMTSDIQQEDKRKRRDHRVDALRGLALLMMLTDHVVSDWLNRLTMRNFGFADAADIFVLLAGYASYLAYGRLVMRPTPNGGWRKAIHRIVTRCVRLYLFQLILLFFYIALTRFWRLKWDVPTDFLEPELSHGFDWILDVVTLQALPDMVNILPIYIVFLLSFLPMYWLLLRSPFLLLAGSFTLWLLVNLDPSINLPNVIDSDGWYFDPFAWQFIFAIGVLLAYTTSRYGGNLSVSRHLRGLCITVLIIGLIECFPYPQYGLPDLRLFHLRALADKSSLGPLRIIDVLAIFALVQSSAWCKSFAASRAGQILAVIGRHSLEVFCLGTVLDLIIRLIMATFGTDWPLQITSNLIGFLCVYGLAVWLDHHKYESALMEGKTRAEIDRRDVTPNHHYG